MKEGAELEYWFIALSALERFGCVELIKLHTTSTRGIKPCMGTRSVHSMSDRQLHHFDWRSVS